MAYHNSGGGRSRADIIPTLNPMWTFTQAATQKAALFAGFLLGSVLVRAAQRVKRPWTLGAFFFCRFRV